MTDGGATDRETHRWRGITAVAFLAGGVGVIVSRPSVVLLAVLGLGFAAYARNAEPPGIDLAVERRIDDSTPLPDDEIGVTVTVRNEGDRPLWDLRLIDDVPDALEVVDRPARHGTALRPGEEDAFSYRLTAVRGDHQFGPVQVVARDPSGAAERETTVAPAEPTTVTCVPQFTASDEVPLRSLTTPHTGRVTSDAGGAGVEFHSIRQYRPGDPLHRVAWRELARRGELATVEFHEERMASVVLVVDARQRAYRAADGGRHAVELSLDAVRTAFAALFGDINRVGVASLSPDVCWVSPGVGREHRARVRETLATHPSLAPTPPEEPFYPPQLSELRKRLPDDAQVLLFSPVADDYLVEVARKLDSRGHLVTVVSPDVTGTDTAGHLLARAERAARLHRLRKAGIRVVDWDTDRSLQAALAGAARRWSA